MIRAAASKQHFKVTRDPANTLLTLNISLKLLNTVVISSLMTGGF